MSRYLTAAAGGVLALAACAFAGAASAQDYGRLVVFGDSLSDNGNLYAVTLGTQPPSPPYYQGRFSTGLVFTELLGFNAGRFAAGAPVTGSINYAFGGAVTGLGGTPPGLTSQLNAYLAAGGRFGATDLVSVLGGANDIFEALPVAGASATPAAAILPTALAAAANVNALVDRIAAAGAGTVVVTNLPNLAMTPQFSGTSAAPLADYAGSNLNAQLLTRLNATAAARPGTNIIYVDLYKANGALVANPGAFGLTNVTQSCFNQTAMTVCSDPGYLYFDGVHPTARGHEIIAALVEDYIHYADAGAGATAQGETAFRHREDSLDAATAALAMRGPWSAGTTISVSGSIDDTQTDARGPVGEVQSDGYGARMSAEHSPSQAWRFGIAGDFRSADVEAGAHSFELQSIGIDVYAGWRSDAAFLNLAAGAASDDYEDIRRQTTLAPIVHAGSTRGNSFGARAQAGMWFDMGGIALSPRVATSWVSSEVDGYFEQGVAAQYAYGDRTVEAITAEATLRAEATMGGFGVFAEGGYRDSLDDSRDPVRIGIAGNPAQAIAAHVDEPFGAQVLAKAGVQGDWGPVRITAGYTGRFGDYADSHMGGIKLTLALP